MSSADATLSGATMRGGVAGDRSRRARLVIAGLGILAAVTAFLSLAVGATGFTPGEALRALVSALAGRTPADDLANVIVLEIRLPRTGLGLLVGAGLAVSGVVMQGLFRNPLADPALVGVSSGAALAAVTVIVASGLLPSAFAVLPQPFMLPAAAFAGGLATTIALYRIATRNGRTSVATMLLAGIALGALAGALTGLAIYASDDQQLRDFTFWSLGSLAGGTLEKVALTAPLVLGALLAVPYLGDRLDGLLLGEAEAGHLGVEVQRLKRVAIVLVALAVGASVAAAGPIGFIGIVVPHLLRLVIGPRHRNLLIASALLGAALLVGADMVARTVVAPAELPIGIVTAIIGAPFFLWLLLRQRALLDV